MAGEERKPAAMSAAITASTAGAVRGRWPKPAADETANHVSSRDGRPPAAEAAYIASRSSFRAVSSLVGSAA
eukprot:784660-Lingulodinium_polyedra.AAC.1